MCKNDLPLEAFKENKKRADGLQSQCIECHKEYRRQHYLKNREKYIKLSAERKEEFLSWWREYKKQFVCKCGQKHPACIDFHHPNDDKEANVCELVSNKSKEKLLKEIAKCIPMCSNCHRILHYNQNAGLV